MDNKRNFKQLWGLGLESSCLLKKKVYKVILCINQFIFKNWNTVNPPISPLGLFWRIYPGGLLEGALKRGGHIKYFWFGLYIYIQYISSNVIKYCQLSIIKYTLASGIVSRAGWNNFVPYNRMGGIRGGLIKLFWFY